MNFRTHNVLVARGLELRGGAGRQVRSERLWGVDGGHPGTNGDNYELLKTKPLRR